MTEVQALDTIRQIQQLGYLTDLTPEEQDVLLSCPETVDELSQALRQWVQGEYPQPGDVLQSMSLYGSFLQLWRYELGFIPVNRIHEYGELPLYRFYINDVLVGLIIEKRKVLDLFTPYLLWLEKQMDIVLPMEKDCNYDDTNSNCNTE